MLYVIRHLATTRMESASLAGVGNTENRQLIRCRNQRDTIVRVLQNSTCFILRYGCAGLSMHQAVEENLIIRGRKTEESCAYPTAIGDQSMVRTMSGTMKRGILLAGLTGLLMSGTGLAQHEAVGFTKGMPFSEGYVSGNTLYVAGQQGPDSHGKVTGTDITLQTTNAIGAVEKIVKEAGYQMTDIVSVTVYVTDLNDVGKMNEVYKKLMPDPKPARATVQVAGLIGGAKIEISAIAVKH